MTNLNVPTESFEGRDSTYFVVSDVMPHFKDGVLMLCNYRGTWRSWGAPSCASKAENLTPDVIKVEVVGWHKHTVSPVGGTYYFVRNAKTNEWERKRANAKIIKAAINQMKQEGVKAKA